MRPSLLVGDRILCNKLKKTKLNVNDVIIFWKPKTEVNLPKEKSYVMAKRVLGVHNDEYSAIDIVGKNNTPNYQLSKGETTNTENSTLLSIPVNHYFVQGDYSTDSRDSRYWGLVHDSLIIGTASFIVWSDWDENKPPNKRSFNWNRFLKKIPEPIN